MVLEGTDAQPVELGVPRVTRAILIADIVESVRLLERNEAETISHWLVILDRLGSEIFPAFHGRLVRNLGDGVLVEFEQVTNAISAAFAIQQACHHDNIGRPADSHIMLRIGIEVGEVLIVQHDVFGHTVNLAARLSTLAGPGEIVVSARVREQLTPVLDADVEDLGECYVKHLERPIRAYRVGPPGPHPVLLGTVFHADIRPTIAIVPLAARNPTSEHQWTGEVLAEEIIRGLTRSPDLNVISRLSTAPFRGRGLLTADIGARLDADYVLSGSYSIDGDKVTASAELAEAKSGRVVWVGTVQDQLAALVQGDCELVAQIVLEIRRAVMLRELERVRSQSLPTLRSYSLLMAAIALMHRMSLRDFEEARHLLETIIDRAKRQALPQAWLAQWFVLRWQQGWSPDPQQDAYRALECTKQALDADPDCSLALAVDGLVQTHFLKRLDLARARYHLAVETNPNDSLAWLLKGTTHAFMGQGHEAVDNTQRALRLSPLDPHRYYYESLAGTACLAAEDYEGALRYALSSLRANRTHTSTWRVATIAMWRLGRHDEAREAAQKLLTLEPGLTIERYLARSPAAPFDTGKTWSDALRQAGVPD
jgi:adenylate cyclase